MNTGSRKKISNLCASARKNSNWLLGASLIFLMQGTAQASDLFDTNAESATIGTLSEYTADYSKAQIYASSAYLRGFNGAGQVVAVFDSGVNRSNADLAGQVLNGYNALQGTVGVTNDTMGHGTFVSGIVAASSNGVGSEGLAFGAKVYPVQVINAAGSVATTDGQMATGIAYAINNNAHIFNESFNSTSTIAQTNAYSLNYTMPATLWLQKYAVSIGDVFVVAAGNSSAAEPGYLAALPNLFPYLKGGFLSVVATDSTGALASYSNACGSTAAYCLAAPGSNILSTYGTGYGIGSGTSFAAPQVSAALAILLQEFPYLTAAQAAQILLQTATKTGIYANTAVYGQGLLNLNAATNPVGTVSIPTTTNVGGIKVAAATSGTIGSQAASQSWAKSIGPILVLDSYNRAYTINSSVLVASPTHTLDTRQVTTQYGFGDMPEIAPGMYGFSTGNAFTGDQQARFAIKNKNGLTIEASKGTDPAYGFGNFADGSLPAGSLVVADGAANPYLNLADQAGAAHIAMPIHTGNGTLHLSATMFNGYAKTSDLTAQLTDPSYSPPTVTGAAMELGGNIEAIDTHLSINAGGVRENGRLLGSSSSGAFGTTNFTDTYFAGADVSMKLADNLHLIGGYEVGMSNVSQSTSAFNVQYGSIQSESFHAGLVQDAVFSDKDKMGFIFSEPMRVTSGTANVTVPTARDFYGNIVTSSQSLSTADNGQELNLQGFYSYHPTEGSSIDAGVLVRLQPDNVATAATETIGIMRWTAKF